MDLADEAVALAQRLHAESRRRESRAGRDRSRRLAALLDDPHAKALTLALTDEVARIGDPARAGRRLRDLVGEHGVPGAFGAVDRLSLRVGAALAGRVPGAVVPLVQRRIRRESRGVVLPARLHALERHVRRRARQGIRVNVNLLGEAVLGEGEAARRAGRIEALLRDTSVDYVSVKISSVFSQVDALAFDDSVASVSERLSGLFRAAAAARPAKFVNLDMEEYRDLAPTLAAFRTVLDDDELAHLDAGIVLQAYLPDSLPAARELVAWARRRHERAGGRVKVRLVKGANLAMERVEAELRGWPPAPLPSKAEVDAHYKRLLGFLLDPAHGAAVRVGVASHNLFDVAYGWVLACRNGVADRVDVEMLEGMAEAEAIAVRAILDAPVVLYAPVVDGVDFTSAVAYLVRRLDENTGPDNYLRHSLGEPAGWFAGEAARFRRAVSDASAPAPAPRRTQDRTRPGDPGAVAAADGFVNEPDTDFTSAANRAWVAAHVSSPPDTGPVRPAAIADVDGAVAAARAAAGDWAARTPEARRRVLDAVAEVMAEGRGDAIALMAHEAGKPLFEADTEVSEAIDFARYYGWCAYEDARRGTAGEPLGVVAVASPWNFPYAIPAGGVFAALAAGNTVALKPAPETRAIALLLAQQCWEGGVPRDALVFVPCPDDESGRRLITHPDVDAVVLTGSYETARLFRSWRPGLRLHAETSGKNAIVVTAAADIDLAIRDVVRSAFGHAGQKCSAASLAIVEASVYDDPAFHARLADAARSLAVGLGTDARTFVGPLVRSPEAPLRRALTTIDPGEEWVLVPRDLGGDRLWTPGIKRGVAPGSFFHLTECFGPVLGVMRADDLQHATALQNATDYGLTGGLQSLDPAEVDWWLEHVEVGNAYVNRHITGAIVGRQPFGGWKRSAVGPTAKAGGPNYVRSLQKTPPVAADRWPAPDRIAAETAHAWREEFAGGRDVGGLRAEANVLRYRARPGPILLRVAVHTSLAERTAATAAARSAGVEVVVCEDDDAAFARRVERERLPVRSLAPVPDVVWCAALEAGVEVDGTPASPDPRLELQRWVREQSVSITLHRHGNPTDSFHRTGVAAEGS